MGLPFLIHIYYYGGSTVIVKRTDSGQYLLFPEVKPLYKLCPTCARLIPDGNCVKCKEEIHTTTPWNRIDNLPIKKERKPSRNRRVEEILRRYKFR